VTPLDDLEVIGLLRRYDVCFWTGLDWTVGWQPFERNLVVISNYFLCKFMFAIQTKYAATIIACFRFFTSFIQALEALNKKDITEIKSYGKPPPLVEKVLEAVMILRGNEPTWAEAKRQLGMHYVLLLCFHILIINIKFWLNLPIPVSFSCTLPERSPVSLITIPCACN